MAFMRIPMWERLVRVSVAFSFLYPPIAALTDPYSWVGYFPPFLTALAAPHELLLLHLFGVLEVAIALWILFGKRPWIPSLGAVLLLVAIVVTSPSQFAVLFRDISIALAAAALTYHHWPRTV